MAAAVALQLPRDARWRAIQSCSDLPERLPGFAKPGNRTALLKIELSVTVSHGNTSCGWCTSFVNSGGPAWARPRKEKLDSRFRGNDEKVGNEGTTNAPPI